jgi:hypothetical protein
VKGRIGANPWFVFSLRSLRFFCGYSVFHFVLRFLCLFAAITAFVLTFAALRLCVRFSSSGLFASIRGPFCVDDGAAHVAGFDGLMHEVVEIGGVFPGLNAAFFNEFSAQFADAIGEGFVPTDVIGGYILNGVELPPGFIEESANGRQD